MTRGNYQNRWRIARYKTCPPVGRSLSPVIVGISREGHSVDTGIVELLRPLSPDQSSEGSINVPTDRTSAAPIREGGDGAFLQ